MATSSLLARLRALNSRHKQKFWWCNQAGQWSVERKAEVVCSEKTQRSKYRNMVVEASKGDIVVHYVSGKGIVAVSRVLADGREQKGGEDNPCGYKRGWMFPVEYYDLKAPVPLARIREAVVELDVREGPIVGKTKRVRQEYFMRFSRDGLRVIRDASKEEWPEWAEAALSPVPPAPTPSEGPLASDGAGFGNARQNVLVEKAAIAAVKKQYRSKGWSVESVESEKIGYDLLCRKGDEERHLEVKGVSGTERAFTITAAELRRADGDENFFLCVVTSALNAKRRKLLSWRGAEIRSVFALSPVSYRARLKEE